jgi:DNA processing protein
VAVYQLAQVPGVGATRINRLLAKAREAKCSLDDALGTPETTENLLSEEQVAAYARLDCRAEVEAIEDSGVEVMFPGDGRYPRSLEKRLGPRCPPLLFCKGDGRMLSDPAISIAGSRQASAESLALARDLAVRAALGGRVVTSGYAGGVDTAAHAGALEAGGWTVLVLAEGLLRGRGKDVLSGFYDEPGLVIVSQFLPKTGWSASNAMQRNQTICALAEAVFVIEAGERGGSLAAGRAALSLGVPLFVPAGLSHQPTGNRTLLHEGARPLPEGRWTIDELLATVSA